MTRDTFVYVGGFTHTRREDTGRQGIDLYRLSPDDGGLELLGRGPAIANPSYLVLTHDGRRLYAVNEEQGQGGVTALHIHGHTHLPEIINKTRSMGEGPCYISLDATERYALVANFRSGSVAVLPIMSDGRLGPATGFAQHDGEGQPGNNPGPHAHSIRTAPGNAICLACDLGLDAVLLYDLDHITGKLSARDPDRMQMAAGSGARHQLFSQAGDRLYICSQLDAGLWVYAWENGAARLLQHLCTLPEGWDGRVNNADLHLTPDERFLYVSNRGHDSIAGYRVEEDGAVVPIGWTSTQGEWPRNFCIDPSGEFLLVANQFSNNIVSFRINGETGDLTPTGAVTPAPAPSCIVMYRP